jgi:copper chaperone CopZ
MGVMIKEYNISGMTCESCVSRVSQALQSIDGLGEVTVQLDYPQARIAADQSIDFIEVNKVLSKAGKYAISNEKTENTISAFPVIKRKEVLLPDKSINTYKPLLLIVAFIAGVTLLSQHPFANFSGMLWMRHFMAGFFIVFAFFKLLNLNGFANTYQMYDIVAAKWKGWGYIYPFVELTLGLLYLTNLAPSYVNIATIAVLGISSIGVIKSNLDKKVIKCACLGDVFNLPMSTVTIVEDLSMVAMAVVMLIMA